MRGRIYSDQKCQICKSTFYHDDRRRGVFCKKHPDQYATGQFKVRFGRDVTKRFKTYGEAERFLDGLRFKTDEGSFDARDYKKDNPLGFTTLAQKWLTIKEKEIKRKSYNNLKNYMNSAMKIWGQTNIKNIGYAEIEDFLFLHKVSDKTRANMKSCLNSFWAWLRKRKVIPIQEMPEFPEIHFELGWRKTIDKETQEMIIAEIHRLTFNANPKIWLGVKWLATYISIRPGELVRIQEKHVDVNCGYLIIPNPKEKKPKLVPILREDIEILESIPKGLPELPFFRHTKGISGCKAGQAFGEKYFYKWWKRACDNLKVEGIDLYGGTRHSTALALRKVATPEQIKRATMHSTNKAFERYFRVESDEVRSIYQLATELTKADQPLTNQNKPAHKAKVLNLKDKVGGGGGS